MTVIATEIFGVIKYTYAKKIRKEYNPAFWDALRATKRNSRQKRLVKKAISRGGNDAVH